MHADMAITFAILLITSPLSFSGDELRISCTHAGTARNDLATRLPHNRTRVHSKLRAWLNYVPEAAGL
jgi:hypothetical protein